MKTAASAFALLALCICTSPAAACSFNHSTTESVRSLVENSGGWPISDEKCKFLNEKKLSISVVSQQAVLLQTAIGWATVQLEADGIVSNAYYSATRANSTDPSTPASQRLAYDAIKEGIANLDFEKAAREIAEKRKRILMKR